MISLKSLALAGLCLLVAAPVSFAGDVAGDATYNIARLVAEARRANPDLQAARFGLDASRAHVAVAGLGPTPRLELGAGTDAPFGNDGEYGASIGVSQDFSVGHRIARQEEVARLDAAIAEADVADQARLLEGALAIDAYRLLVIDRRLQVRADLLAQTDALAKATEARFKAAEMSELDVNAVRLDGQQQAQARQWLEMQRQSIVASLNARLGRSLGAPLVIDEPLPPPDALPPLARWQARAQAARPDLRAASLAVDRAAAARALAEAERWEDWSAGVALKQDRLAIDGVPSQSPGRSLELSLSIPLPLAARNGARVAEANAGSAQAASKVASLRQAIDLELATAWREADLLQRQLATCRDGMLPVSARNVRLAQKGYIDGLAALPDVLQAGRQNADVNNACLDTLDQYLQALVRLRTAAGDDSAAAPDNQGNP